MDRREFLQAGAAGLALSASGVYAAPADRKLRAGLFGCGWYGKTNLFSLVQVTRDNNPVEIVSLCDVDRKMLDEAADRFGQLQASKKRPKTFGDYRKMLAERDLDLVIVGTPDHWHALPTIAALEAGADVFVQKPISVDVAEGRAMVEAARKHGKVVQVGTQRRSTPHIVEARDRVVREGLLGTIGLVEVCCYYHMRATENPPDEAPPANLDWETWTGPAPLRPYNRLCHPRGWRAFMEYGNGIVGDMCIHMLDMVRFMLGLGWPRRISSSGGILVDTKSKANITDTQTATFEFPDFPVVWTHRTWGDPPDPKYPWAAVLYGDKGTLKVDVNHYDFEPAGGGKKLHGDVISEVDRYPEDPGQKDLDPASAPANRRLMDDFLRALASRGKPVADIEEGHISTASCILANLAMKLGRTLTWDASKHQVVGDDEANRLLRRPYRKPWVHPASAG
jgi:predicted dehydrogenase